MFILYLILDGIFHCYAHLLSRGGEIGLLHAIYSISADRQLGKNL